MKILRLGQFAYASSEINHQCPGSLLRATPAADFFSNGKFDFPQSYRYSALCRSLLDTLESVISWMRMKIQNHSLLINITTEFHIFPRNNLLFNSVLCELFLRTQAFHR